MNLPTFERAQLVAFAYRLGRHTGNLECMRAICFVLRNRVRAGWSEGWIQAIERAPMYEGNPPGAGFAGAIDPSDRLFQMILRDVDDIYMGQDRSDDSTRLIAIGDNPPKSSALYFMFVGRAVTDWFAEKIVRNPNDHPQIGNIGGMLLFR